MILHFPSLQGEKTRQRKKSVTFQLPSENKHVLALDFLSWIMVRMVIIFSQQYQSQKGVLDSYGLAHLMENSPVLLKCYREACFLGFHGSLDTVKLSRSQSPRPLWPAVSWFGTRTRNYNWRILVSWCTTKFSEQLKINGKCMMSYFFLFSKLFVWTLCQFGIGVFIWFLFLLCSGWAYLPHSSAGVLWETATDCW